MNRRQSLKSLAAGLAACLWPWKDKTYPQVPEVDTPTVYWTHDGSLNMYDLPELRPGDVVNVCGYLRIQSTYGSATMTCSVIDELKRRRVIASINPGETGEYVRGRGWRITRQA